MGSGGIASGNLGLALWASWDDYSFDRSRLIPRNMEKTILLVDDDADDIALISEALAEINDRMRIKTAQNGQDAVKLLLADTNLVPHYIFLDQNMPKMDGRECLIQLRKIARLNNTPIFILTTSRLQKDGVEFRRLGASYCFTKPSAYSELKKLLFMALSGSWHTAPSPYR